MKNEPWVRFGILISPKISENPADSRNKSPPSVTLLTASTSQRFMFGERAAVSAGGRAAGGSALQRRIAPRIDGLGEEPLLLVRPELAHVRIGLDRRVDELVALPLAAPDEDVADDVAEMVELEWSARRV